LSDPFVERAECAVDEREGVVDQEDLGERAAGLDA
jgi:hypothetical protein